jgi:hypothetical protein
MRGSHDFPAPLHCFAPADSTRESALVASGERYALTEAVEVVMIRQVEVVIIRLDRGQVHVEDPRPWDCDSAAGKVSASEGGFSGGKGARVKPTF